MSRNKLSWWVLPFPEQYVRNGYQVSTIGESSWQSPIHYGTGLTLKQLTK